MTAYDRWLEQPFQEACEREDEFDAIVEELLDGELNPRNPDMFMEAINEGCCLDNKHFNDALKKILASKTIDEVTHELGKLVYEYVADYCNETAQSRAEAIYTMRRRKA